MGAEPARLLIIDDEPITLGNLAHVLTGEGYAVKTAGHGKEALRLLGQEPFDVVLTDLRMQGVDGMQILEACRRLRPPPEVIMITGFATIDTAVEAMKHGAFHYITKPFKLGNLRQLVREAVDKSRARQHATDMGMVLDRGTGESGIITRDPVMLQLLERVRVVAPSGSNVLILGESGTGKELFARYLHQCSGRAEQPFLAVNCGAFASELLANELFGHEKGAFTHAVSARTGLLEAASKGTLLLDEVAEMDPSLQVKFLRVIQEQEFFRVGGNTPRRVDVRFIAATNRNLPRMLENGTFRRDLYYRLNVVTIKIPPLSERPRDVGLLAHHFLKRFNTIMGREVAHIAPETLRILEAYPFPGNVRELENIIEQGILLVDGETLTPDHLPEDVRTGEWSASRSAQDELTSLEVQELRYIQRVLRESGGNRSRAAEILGIDRVSLWRKLKRHGL